MPTLTLSPAWEISEDRTARILSSQFGDGYEERAPDGLNPLSSTWAVRVNGMTQDDADGLDELLSDWAGVIAFHWHPMGQATPRLYTCAEWSFAYEGPDVLSFSAQFKEVFIP